MRKLTQSSLLTLAALIGFVIGCGGERKDTKTAADPSQSSMSIRSATATRNGIWLSSQEIMALPMSGAAWTTVRNTACGAWSTPNLAYQFNGHAAETYAGALVYVRAGDLACTGSGVSSLRAKVRDAILGAKRTFDEYSEYCCINGPDAGYTPNGLAIGRQLSGYVIAADLIDLPGYDSVADGEFRPWLGWILTLQLPLSNPVNCSLIAHHEYGATNWAFFIGASRIAASLYLGDMADVDRAARIFRAYSDRSEYPSDPVVPPGYPLLNYFYKVYPADTDTWTCDATNWTAVNAPCTKSIGGSGRDVDGAIVQDIMRSRPATWPPGKTGMMYTAESLQGHFEQAEMLHRIGYDSYGHGNQAGKRAMDFLVRAGWTWPYVGQRWVIRLANYRYGTSYPDLSMGYSYSMGFTDWTHAGTAPPITPTPTPTPTPAGPTPTPTPTPTPSPSSGCLSTVGSNWLNSPLGSSQMGRFVAEFDATPSVPDGAGVIGLSNGSASSYSNLAAIVDFELNGLIQARDGGTYRAISSIPYTRGTSYHFRLDLDIVSHTYSAYVRSGGGPEMTIGSDFAFRTEQASVTVLSNLGARAAYGSIQVCNPMVHSGLPDPTTSILSGGRKGVILTGTLSGVPDPKGSFSIQVKDTFSHPIPNIQVDLDFTNCSYVEICSSTVGLHCSDGFDPIRPNARIVSGVTDSSGNLQLDIAGAPVSPGVGISGGACAELRVGGVSFPKQVVSVLNIDGSGEGPNGGAIDANDLSTFLSDYFSGEYRPRSDFHGDESLDANDLSIWLGRFFDGAISACRTTSCGPSL